MDAIIDSTATQFVVFRLDDEEYGVNIRKVTTIEKLMTIARVPKTPDYVKGVINLRGEIIPIMDLRTRLKMAAIEETDDTRIIIIRIDDISLGIIVDAVMEVLQLDENSIESISGMSNDSEMDYIYGVGKVCDRIVTLLNIEKLIKIC